MAAIRYFITQRKTPSAWHPRSSPYSATWSLTRLSRLILQIATLWLTKRSLRPFTFPQENHDANGHPTPDDLINRNAHVERRRKRPTNQPTLARSDTPCFATGSVLNCIFATGVFQANGPPQATPSCSTQPPAPPSCPPSTPPQAHHCDLIYRYQKCCRKFDWAPPRYSPASFVTRRRHHLHTRTLTGC